MQESLLTRRLKKMVRIFFNLILEEISRFICRSKLYTMSLNLISDDQSPSHLSLQFRVFLRNATTKRYTQEKRVISYWFKVAFSPMQQASAAQDFFKQLVSPTDFPRGKDHDLNIQKFKKRNIFGIVDNLSTFYSVFFRLRRIHKENNETNAT